MTQSDDRFKDLDIEAKLALHRAFYEGKTIQFRPLRECDWEDTPAPAWFPNSFYRVKPEPLRDISIPWAAIKPYFRWAARDENGAVWLYSARPQLEKRSWHVADMLTNSARADNILVMDPGNKPWDQSLIERPNQ